jgi:hypothetical protein
MIRFLSGGTAKERGWRPLGTDVCSCDPTARSFSDAGVITVKTDSSSQFGPVRTFGSLALVILCSVVCGCDSSPSNTTMPTTKILDKPLPPEKLEKWVGEGANKHKEAISRGERLDLIREAAKQKSN